jgi:prolipoprotein diacylglyceryl transferase
VGVAPLASIPSPPDSTLDIGPLHIHIYGLLLAIGVVVATRIAMLQWERHGGKRSDILDIAVVVVIAGVIGARLYHVATDYQRFEGNWVEALRIWRGGLSIWGVMIGGAIGVVVMTRIKHLDTIGVLDAIVPGLLVAQGIGRWGNWFNQELFGKPTDLPWGLQIDLAKRPPGYERYATFHPTFLYESLYVFAAAVVLLWADRRFRMRRGQALSLYFVVYCFGRFFFENLRIDPAHVVAGMRVNAWVSLLGFILGSAAFVWFSRRLPLAGCARYSEPVADSTASVSDAQPSASAPGADAASVEHGATVDPHTANRPPSAIR